MNGTGKVPAALVDTVCEEHVVFDVVYGRTETDLLRRARSRGAQTVDGKAMFLAQAIGAFRLWTGQTPQTDVMQTAADA